MTEIWALNGVLKLPFAPLLYHRIGMASSSPDINKVGIDITWFTLKRIPVSFNSRQSLAPSRCLFILSSHLSLYLFFKGEVGGIASGFWKLWADSILCHPFELQFFSFKFVPCENMLSPWRWSTKLSELFSVWSSGSPSVSFPKAILNLGCMLESPGELWKLLAPWSHNQTRGCSWLGGSWH